MYVVVVAHADSVGTELCLCRVETTAERAPLRRGLRLEPWDVQEADLEAAAEGDRLGQLRLVLDIFERDRLVDDGKSVLVQQLLEPVRVHADERAALHSVVSHRPDLREYLGERRKLVGIVEPEILDAPQLASELHRRTCHGSAERGDAKIPDLHARIAVNALEADATARRDRRERGESAVPWRHGRSVGIDQRILPVVQVCVHDSLAVQDDMHALAAAEYRHPVPLACVFRRYLERGSASIERAGLLIGELFALELRAFVVEELHFDLVFRELVEVREVDEDAAVSVLLHHVLEVQNVVLVVGFRPDRLVEQTAQHAALQLPRALLELGVRKVVREKRLPRIGGRVRMRLDRRPGRGCASRHQHCGRGRDDQLVFHVSSLLSDWIHAERLVSLDYIGLGTGEIAQLRHRHVAP